MITNSAGKELIDQYLADGVLRIAQHKAALNFLEQACQVGVDWGKKGKSGEGVDLYGRTVRLVRRRFGEYAAYILQEVVVYGWDVTGMESEMKALLEALDLIVDRTMRSGGWENVSLHEIPIEGEIIPCVGTPPVAP